MSWAEVKKINSDMSTPLDVLIKGDKILVPSNIAIAVMESNGKYFSFTPKLNGKVNFTAKAINTSSDQSYRSVGIEVYEDGKRIAQSDEQGLGFEPGMSADLSVVANVVAGKKYRASIYRGSVGIGVNMHVDAVYACAQIVDASQIEIEEV